MSYPPGGQYPGQQYPGGQYPGQQYPHGPYGQRPDGGRSTVKIVLIVLAVLAVLGLALIAVVAAILFPAFAQAREAARHANCMSNLKNQVMAANLYAESNGNTLPPAASWANVLPSYGIITSEMSKCPSDKGGGNSYAYNAKLNRRNLAQVSNPAFTPMMFDSSLGQPNANDTLQSFAPRHRRAGNVMVGGIAYVDGHVKSEPTAPPALPQ